MFSSFHAAVWSPKETHLERPLYLSDQAGSPADVLTGTGTADKGQALTCLQVSVLNVPSSTKSTISELFASQINYDLHPEASVRLLVGVSAVWPGAPVPPPSCQHHTGVCVLSVPLICLHVGRTGQEFP